MDRFLPIKEVISERIEKGLLRSAIIGAYKDGKPIFKYNIGCVDKQIFRLASMTKPITAVACLKCAEMGLLSTKDRVDKYLPSFANRKVGQVIDGKVEFLKDSDTPMTIEHILTHSSGFASGVVGERQLDINNFSGSLKERVEKYATWYLDFESGKSSAYSPICALDIVARIVEIVSGMEYFQFLRKYIFEPLDMVDTVYRINDEQKKRLVPMHYLNDDGKNSYHKELDENYGCFDFFRWITSGVRQDFFLLMKITLLSRVCLRTTENLTEKEYCLQIR